MVSRLAFYGSLAVAAIANPFRDPANENAQILSHPDKQAFSLRLEHQPRVHKHNKLRLGASKEEEVESDAE